VIESDAPAAFVAGLWRPAVYVSASLKQSLSEQELSTLIAHEESHRRRRDPLRRIVAGAALCFHLPWVAQRISELLAETQELIADRDAACAGFDPLDVAETLVRCGRLPWGREEVFAEFSGASLQTRLEALVSRRSYVEGPTAMALSGMFGVCAVAAVIAGPALHFVWQIMLRLP
jgi:beta-lactamase regulating signal transducer with metallopeptidase domain